MVVVTFEYLIYVEIITAWNFWHDFRRCIFTAVFALWITLAKPQSVISCFSNYLTANTDICTTISQRTTPCNIILCGFGRR